MQQKSDINENNIVRNPIIFFDGVCGLCNSFVNIIYNSDKNKLFMYSPLQGETAKRYLPDLPEHPEEWSIVYIDELGIYMESDATLRILERLGGMWSILAYFRFIPKNIRDLIYRIVAKYRYRLFGKYDSCRIPGEEEKARFLP